MIIGICGFIGSGKDTIAKYLIDRKGYQKYSWASPLKDAVSTIFGWDRNMIEGIDAEDRAIREAPDEWWSSALNYDFSPRNALQHIGTDIMRNQFHQDIWVLSGMRHLQQMDNVVVPDTRFINEIHAIKALGGQVWRVTRGPFPEWYSYLSHYKETYGDEKLIPSIMSECFPDVHESEYSWHGFDEFDQLIFNDGDLDSLYQQLDTIENL